MERWRKGCSRYRYVKTRRKDVEEFLPWGEVSFKDGEGVEEVKGMASLDGVEKPMYTRYR